MHVVYIKFGIWDLSGSARISVDRFVKETEKTFTISCGNRNVRINKSGLSFRTFNNESEARLFANKVEKESGLSSYIASCKSTHQKKIAASDGIINAFNAKD